jgi:hypothetical protein
MLVAPISDQDTRRSLSEQPEPSVYEPMHAGLSFLHPCARGADGLGFSQNWEKWVVALRAWARPFPSLCEREESFLSTPLSCRCPSRLRPYQLSR